MDKPIVNAAPKHKRRIALI